MMKKNLLKKLSGIGLKLTLSVSSLSSMGSVSSYYRVRNYSGGTKAYSAMNSKMGSMLKPGLHLSDHKREIKKEPVHFHVEQGKRIKELVIIDAAIKDKALFHKYSTPTVDVIELTGNQGLREFMEVLSKYEDLEALHIISHATSGQLQINGTLIDQAKLQETSILESFDKAVKDKGDVFFYGCELGKGAEGEDFLEIIKEEAKVDVAASDDQTGNKELNADWDLEITKGNIEASPLTGSIALNDFTEVLQFTGTIQFDQIANSGNYSGDSTNDASFYTSSLKEYTLVVDGTSGGTGSYYSIAAIEDGVLTFNGESKIRFSFSAGETFDVNGSSSIYIFNYSGAARAFTFTGDNGVLATSASIGNSAGAYISLNNNNTGLTYIDITANGSFYAHFSLFKVANVSPSASPVSASISSQTDVACNGESTGSLTVTASDGTTPYTYSWSNAATTATISTLAAGTYTVTVTDGSGSTSTATATITQPNALDPGMVLTN